MFDVDGVLTDRGEPINSEFKHWFLNWCENHNVGFLTGSDREKSVEQIGNELFNIARISGHSMGNEIYFQGERYLLNQINLTESERQFMQSAIDACEFVIKNGNHITLRPGSINLSFPGRGVDAMTRKQFKKYDAHTEIRKKFIDEFRSKFPRFEAYLGGDTSIDICLQGGNKGDFIRLSDALAYTGIDKILYYGDRIYEYGIDYPVEQLNNNFVKCIQIDNGYMQTKEVLLKLCG